MNSNIPIISTDSTKNSVSRLPRISSTLKRPPTGTYQNTLTTIKKSRNDSEYIRNEFAIPQSSNKFKRSFPLTLMKSKNIQNEFKQPAERLDFSDTLRTPTFYKNVAPLPSVSKIPIITSSSLDSNNENTSTKCTKVESKGTSPVVDWSTISKETEIISYKVRINVLQKEIDELQCKNSKLRIDNEVNETKLRNDIEDSKEKIKGLTEEIDLLKNNENKLRYDFEEFQKIHLEQSNYFEKQKFEYEKEIAKLKEELSESKSEEEKVRCKLSMDTLNFQHEINRLKSVSDQLIMENKIYSSNVNDLEMKNKELESTKNELNKAFCTIEQLENELKSYHEGSKLESILQGELSQLKAIKDENFHLKNKIDLLSEVYNENMILKEKIMGLENTIKLLNEQSNQKNVDMHDLESHKEQLQKWIQIVGIDSPDIVVNKINKLNENISLLTVKNDLLKSEINMLKEKKSNDDYISKAYELSLQKANDKIKHGNELLEQINKKCLFLTKERDYYQNIANSLETNNEEINNNRIAELESIVAEYKIMVTELESNLKKTQEELVENKLKDKENEELKNEIKRIKELNPHICTNISMLDVSTLQTNERQFRIIHLQDNPLSIEIKKRVEELNKLKEENQRLKCLVEILERGDSNNVDITRQIDEAIHHRFEMEKLKTSLAKAEKQFKNLKQTFKKSCDSFRLACMELTGYQIDNISKNKYRLRHKYSFKKEFLVEIDGKSIKLFEDSTTKELQDKIQLYLTEHGSYPAFFAAYSLELFNNQTLL